MRKLKAFCALVAAMLFTVPAFGQKISIAAGSWGIPNRSAATVSLDGPPSSVAVDSSGSLYLNMQTRIYKLTSSGALILVAGNGQSESSGDGGPAIDASFYANGMAVDNQGSIYIVDVISSTIRKVDASTGIISTIAGNGTIGDTGDGGPATSAELHPWGVAVDSSGNLYITADDDRGGSGVIRKVDTSGTISTLNVTQCPTRVGSSIISLDGIAVDKSGNLYAAAGSFIEKITPALACSVIAGTPGVDVPSSGDGGPATAAVFSSWTVAVDSASNLYFADSDNSTIRKVDVGTGIISTIAGTGVAGFTSDSGVATSVELNGPGVAVDSSGNLYIADTGNYAVRKVAAGSNTLFTVAGNDYWSYSGDGGPAAEAQMETPGSVAVDSSGNFYIEDSGNHVVRKVDASTGYISTVAGNGTDGETGDGAPAISAKLSDPETVAVDSSGNLYIADTTAYVVRKVDAATGYISTVAGNGTSGNTGDGGPATDAELSYPYRVAVDKSGNLYIGDDAAVRKVDAATGVISTVAGNGTIGDTGDGGPATSASLDLHARGLAVDNSGNLYITQLSGVVREVFLDASDTANYGKITTVAGQPSCSPGTDTSNPLEFCFPLPTGIYVDNAGTIFISDENLSQVYKITGSSFAHPENGVLSVVAGNGVSGYSAVGGPATGVALSEPVGLAGDSHGSLLIADWGNKLVYSVAGVASVAQVATPAFSVAAGSYNAAQTVSLSTPTPNAAIYYTTDGSTPTTGSTVYSGPITVSSTETIEAIAVAKDYFNSPVATATYTINLPAATPVFSPAGGTYTSVQTVTISDATAGAAIYYTTNGSTPTTNSAKYTGAVTVSSTETINAIAAANGYTNSAVASAAYTIILPNPTPVIGTLSPAYAAQGGTAFTLTVNGTGFISGSTVYWGSIALTTSYVSVTQLTASVPASDLASTGTAAITVQSPAPGGGTSNALSFEIDSADSKTYPPTFTTTTVTVTAGSPAAYTVTLPSSASSISVSCLNLPVGASCSYSGAGPSTLEGVEQNESNFYVVNAEVCSISTYPTNKSVIYDRFGQQAYLMA